MKSSKENKQDNHSFHNLITQKKCKAIKVVISCSHTCNNYNTEKQMVSGLISLVTGYISSF